RVVKTTDGGETWTCFDLSSVASRLIDCRFTAPDSGMVVGGVDVDSSSVARILSTGDGGRTWSVRYTGHWPNSWCWKISFPTRQVGWVSVEMFEGNTHCLRTEDGGETWMEVEVFADARDLQGIGFATPTLGWAPPFRTQDGGVTWELNSFGFAINR